MYYTNKWDRIMIQNSLTDMNHTTRPLQDLFHFYVYLTSVLKYCRYTVYGLIIYKSHISWFQTTLYAALDKYEIIKQSYLSMEEYKRAKVKVNANMIIVNVNVLFMRLKYRKECEKRLEMEILMPNGILQKNMCYQPQKQTQEGQKNGSKNNWFNKKWERRVNEKQFQTEVTANGTNWTENQIDRSRK